MQKVIREVDTKRGIVQVTIADERWYMKQAEDPATKLPIFKAVPSVTWIAGHYPKGLQFYKWLAEKGWDESQAIKVSAGDRGTKVHAAIAAILDGYEVRIDSKFHNRSTDRDEELSLEEIECIKSFVDWRASLEKFEPIAWEMTVFSEQHNFAGTIDLLARVNGELYLIDFKTSQQVWTEYHLQVSAYKRALENGENPIYVKNENGTDSNKMVDVSEMKIAILQVGYQRNKNLYKFTDLEDSFDLFLNAQAIWKRETEGQEPKKRDYPIVIASGNPLENIELPEDIDEVVIEKDIVVAEPKVKKVIKKKVTE